jgi:hypothetical protein
MVDTSLASPDRVIGMIQPVLGSEEDDTPPLQRTGCLGRLSGFQEADNNRYLITLTGLIRFDVDEELEALTPYRQIKPTYERFLADLKSAKDSDAINRSRLLELLRQYLDTNNLDADWDMINRIGGEELVNFLSMISPFAAREKQALLEAQTCVERTEVLIALVELALADPGGNTSAPLH